MAHSQEYIVKYLTFKIHLKIVVKNTYFKIYFTVSYYLCTKGSLLSPRETDVVFYFAFGFVKENQVVVIIYIFLVFMACLWLKVA